MQDPPTPPSDTLLVSSFKCLDKTNVLIHEYTQPGDSRPVLSPSQRTISRQIMSNWEPWQTLGSLITTGCFNRWRHKQQSIKATSVQDLNPRSCADNDHESVLAHEMTAIEPGENPSRTITWKPLSFLSHIKSRINDDCFSVSQWDNRPVMSLLGIYTLLH